MKKNLLRVCFVLFFVAITVIYYTTGLNKYFNFNNIVQVKSYLLENFGLYLPFVIVLLYIVFNLTGLPTMFFSILCGYLYGTYFGVFIAWIGMIIGIMSSFISARYLFRDLFQAKFSGKTTVIDLERSIEKYKWRTIILSRVLFVIPYNIQNIVYGLTKVDILSYIIGTAIGIIPITIANVILGYAISNAGNSDLLKNNYFIGFGIVCSVLSIVIGIFAIKYIYDKKKVKAGEKQ